MFASESYVKIVPVVQIYYLFYKFCIYQQKELCTAIKWAGIASGVTKSFYAWTLFTVVLLIGTIYCSEDDGNEVVIGTSIKPPINLDSNLRKALLKALVELENEEKENLSRNTRDDYVNIITHLDSKDKSVEKASASAVSYITRSEPLNMTVTVKKSTSKPKHVVVVQKSKGTHHKTIYANEDLDLSESPEQFIASASSSFTSNLNSAKTEDKKSISAGAQINSVTSKVKTKKTKHDQTTTTPKPTTSTEESEASVESLQFFSAPLVAAFTVHQDEKGLPRSVVPIYNQVNQITNATGKQVREKKKQEQEDLKQEVFKQQKELEARQEEQLRKNQIRLEEEIRRLTRLREEQDRLIKEQKLAYEQKIFEQQKRLFEEQKRLYNNVQPFVPITSTPRPTAPTSTHLNNLGRNTGTLVSVQPSIGFVQPTLSSYLPINAQVLPVKNAIDFRTPFSQKIESFKIQNSINQPLVNRPQNNLISNSIVGDTRPKEFNQASVNLPQNNLLHNSIIPGSHSLPFTNRPQSTQVSLGNTFQNSIPLVNTAQNSVLPVLNTVQNTGFFHTLPSLQTNTPFRTTPVQNVFLTSQNLPFVNLRAPPFRPSEIAPQTHGTRSLRQESGTGNFLNNNRLNSQGTTTSFLPDYRFNGNSFIPQQVSQPAQFFRSNVGVTNPSISQYNTLQYSVDQPFVNQRLNNLLYYSGLGQGRQQEDLNIVSKVLSFNHLGGGDSQFANSNIDSRRTRGSANWRVV
ncbi:hypothetical protein HHI36_006738 [Cryptolaemus montrouzieri]|uniref:Uncharacterized protein n=1 Tax=Cryptolaemus montrouzieri TaxID=559131 RepID=A0ABD2NY98_9CUCU